MTRTTAALVLALLAAPAFAAGPLLEKDVDVPRETRIPVDLVWDKCAILDVETHNAPDAKMVEAAKANDPKDATFLLVRFRYANSDWVSHKVRLRTVLLDADGNVLADAGRTAGLDKGQTDDTISYPMKIRTVDWPAAVKMHVTASFQK